MFARTRIAAVIAVFALLFASLPLSIAAQSEDDTPTWVDSMDSAATGLLSEASPDESLYSYFYAQGQYEMQAHATDFSGDLYSFLNVGQLGDARVSVDFAIDGDQPGKYAFVGCRSGPNDYGYSFEVHPSTGDAKLWVIGENDAHVIAETNASELIAPGFVFNTIEIECWQSIISGAINGEVILAQFDETFTAGDAYIGMGVTPTNPSDIFAVFDNLSVVDLSTQQPPVETAVASTPLQPGLEGALAWAAQNAPTTGPWTASAEVFDGDLKSLPAEVNVATFYAELGFVAPANVPPGLWTVGFCFWIDDAGNCLEMVIAHNAENTSWIFGDSGGSGDYVVIDSGEATGLDLTPGAENMLGLYVDGQSVTLTINSGVPAATVALPRTGVGDIAAQLSFNADLDNEPRSYVMDTYGFAVWDLGAASASTAPALATQPAASAPADSALFDQLKAQAQSQAPIAGPLTASLVQSSTNFPWAPAGVNLTDLFVTATFVNPADTSVPWDIGISIRYTAANTDARIIVSSDGVWNVTIATGEPIASGQVTSFATGPGALNTLEVAASGATGAFALNGLVVAVLDLSASPGPGDVFASSGFYADKVVEGRQVTVQDMSVWAIGAAAPVPTQTVATTQPTAVIPQPTAATSQPTAATSQPTAATSQPTAAISQPTAAPAADGAALFQQQKAAAVSNAPATAPLQGVINQQAGFLSQTNAGVNLADLYVTVTFLNPADTSMPWDFGITIRGTGTGDEFRFFVTSSGAWHVAAGSQSPSLSGQLTNLNTAPGGANTIEITAQGTAGVAVVNGVVATTLDVTAFPQPGNVFAATGFFDENIVADRQIPYVNFQVWPISAAVSQPTTVATAATDPAAMFDAQRALAQTQAPLAGPFSGTLVQSSTTFPFAIAGVNLADFYVTATFLNPADLSTPWNLGIGLRYSDQNAELRFIVDSAGNWSYATGGAAPVNGGQVTNFNAAAGGSNTIEAIAQGTTAYVSLNGQVVTSFDLSANALSGDIFIGTQFAGVGIVEGRQVPYQNFAVWPIGESAVQAAPTQAPGDPPAVFASLKTTALAQSPVAGPYSGTLVQSLTTFPFALAGVNLADFYVSATFANPADLATPWNLGIGLRYSDQNAELRFIIDSTGYWSSATGGAVPVNGGQVANFNAAAGGSNTIEAIVQGMTAYVSVNGQLVTTFDLAANAASGDIFIGTGFGGFGMVEGRQIPYQDFTVWQL